MRRRHVGPLYVQRALYPEADDTAHVLLLHPPGGVVQGDEIVFDVAVESQARALLTTPSAAKLYRAPQRASRQAVRLTAAPKAEVEWLPQETIVFDGARAGNRLDLSLASTARAIAWDIWTLGRPAAGETFERGEYDGALSVAIDGRLHWHERTRVPGRAQSALIDAPWGLGGDRALGTLVAYRPGGFDDAVLAALRERLSEWAVSAAATVVDGLLIIRATAVAGDQLLLPLRAIWAHLRPVVFDKSAVAPRIWAT